MERVWVLKKSRIVEHNNATFREKTSSLYKDNFEYNTILFQDTTTC